MRKGFTLIELMIVIAIIAIIAAIAIPNLLESRITAAESSAASSLRSGVFTGQETFRASAHNDLDDDNKGEYGHFGHLSGTKRTWGNPERSTFTDADVLELLGSQWEGNDVARQTPGTTDDINGYQFGLYLNVDSATTTSATINDAEIYYCAVGVPVAYNDTGRRSFVITNGGTVLTAPGTDLFGVQDAAGGDGVAADAIDNVVTTSTVSCFDAPESACTKDNRGPYWNPQ